MDLESLSVDRASIPLQVYSVMTDIFQLLFGQIENLIYHFDNFLTKLIIVQNCSRNMAESVPISEAKKMRSGVNVEAELISKTEPRTVNLKNGGTVDVCDAVIANEDKSEENKMKLTLWGDDIKAYDVGDNIVIENGYTNEFKGEVSLTKGKFGTMKKI